MIPTKHSIERCIEHWNHACGFREARENVRYLASESRKLKSVPKRYRAMSKREGQDRNGFKPQGFQLF